jgi:hypothetical protein
MTCLFCHWSRTVTIWRSYKPAPELWDQVRRFMKLKLKSGAYGKNAMGINLKYLTGMNPGNTLWH